MKDVLQVFDESLKDIQKAASQDNYVGCSSIATDLITVSIMAGYSDGILIGEVFEGVFDQIAPLSRQFELSEEERESTRETVKRQVGSIAKSYKDEDKSVVYSALRDLRAAATQLQFRCIRFVKPKPEIEPRRLTFRADRRK